MFILIKLTLSHLSKNICQFDSQVYMNQREYTILTNDSTKCFESFIYSCLETPVLFLLINFCLTSLFHINFVLKAIEIKVFNITINCNRGNLIITDEDQNAVDFCKNRKMINFETSQKWIGIVKIGETNFSFKFKVHNANYTKNFTSIPSITKKFSEHTNLKENAILNKIKEILPLPNDCGASFIMPTLRIIGGKPAKPHSWPWQVYLTDGQYSCGASLLNKKVILLLRKNSDK